MIQAGVIGKVTEAHVWTNRPVWPQAPKVTARLKEEECPKHIHWDLFIGPAPERPKAELDTSAHEIQAAGELGSFRSQRIHELPLVREGAAEPGGQHGLASRHQLFDDVCVAQDRVLGHVAGFERRLAENELEALDAATLQRLRIDTGDRRQLLECLDHTVEMDHARAPAADTRSRCSSRVATDESRTRRPT